MRKRFSITFNLILLLTAGSLFSCGPAKYANLNLDPTEEDLAQWAKNQECMRVKEFKPDNRLSHFPFKTAKEVVLVSFDTDDSLFWHRLPLKGKEIVHSKIREKVLLNNEQSDSLSHILYDYAYRGGDFPLEGTGCYNPRNAILFFNRKQRLLEYIEICFECGGNRVSSRKVELGDFCTQKLDMIKDFFIRRNIEIGTIKELEYH